MTNINKLTQKLAEKWKNRTHEDCVKWENGTDGTFVGFLKTALASYANDYCDSLLFVLADIRQKTGVGDKPMLDELADAIVANKTAYGDETYRNGQSDMKSVCVDIADKHGTVVCYNKIRAIPLPSEKVKP